MSKNKHKFCHIYHATIKTARKNYKLLLLGVRGNVLVSKSELLFCLHKNLHTSYTFLI